MSGEIGHTRHAITNETLLHVVARTNKAFAVESLMKRFENPHIINESQQRAVDLVTDGSILARLNEYSLFQRTSNHAKWFGPFFCKRVRTFLWVLMRWRNDKTRFVAGDVV